MLVTGYEVSYKEIDKITGKKRGKLKNFKTEIEAQAYIDKLDKSNIEDLALMPFSIAIQ